METIIYIFLAMIIGALAGVLDTIFFVGLNFASNLRENNLHWILFLLPLAGIFIIYLYKKYGKNSHRGMWFTIKSANTENSVIPKRLIPFVVVSTWLTHLFGGSAGREGVAVQVGATIGNQVGEFTKQKKFFTGKFKDMKKILVSVGMSGGFAGLFGTPIAATIFSVEVLKRGKLEIKAFIPALVSAYTAFFVSDFLGLKHFTHKIFDLPKLNLRNILFIILAGIIFGLVGFCFAYLQKILRENRFIVNLNSYKKIFAGGMILALIFYVVYIIFGTGRYSGLGTNLIFDALNSGEIFYYDFIIKFLLTIITIVIGFQGGEVTPLFAIGASLGYVLATLFNLPIPFMAALGYATVFGGATNTFLAATFIGVEIFGYKMAIYFLMVCGIGRIFSGKLSIYSHYLEENKL
ncbi:MAG: chloride channel protein [Fusobacteriaceae bacterium]